MFQSREDDLFYYSLLSDEGDELLQSPGFTDREAGTASIRELIDQLPNAARYQTYSEGGQAFFGVTNAAGQRLASSPAFASPAAASEAASELVASAEETTGYSVELVSTVTNYREELLPSLTEIDFAHFYDFLRLSRSNLAGFEPFQAEKDQLFYFHFNDAGGQALLYSRGFDTAGRRDKRIRQVIKAAGNPQRFEVVEADGQYYFILKERNNQEIARSRRFANRAEAEAAMGYVQAQMPAWAEQYPEKEKHHRNKDKVQQYDFELQPTQRTPGFDAFKSAKDRGHYFLLNNEAGRPILYSQSYTGAAPRDNGIRAVVRNAALSARYERHEEDGKHYFVLRAGNRQEIAHSAFFSSAAEMEAAIAWMIGQAKIWAVTYQVEVVEETTTQTETFTLERTEPEVATGLLAAGLGLAASLIPGQVQAEEVPLPEPEPAPIPEPEPVMEMAPPSLVVEEPGELPPPPEPEPPVLELPDPEPVVELPPPVVEAETSVAEVVAPLAAAAILTEIIPDPPKVEVVPEPPKVEVKPEPPKVEPPKPEPVVMKKPPVALPPPVPARESAGAARWLLPLLLLLLVGAAIWWGLRSCQPEGQMATVPEEEITPPPVVETTPLVVPPPDTVKVEQQAAPAPQPVAVDPPREEKPKVIGPDARKLGFRAGTFEASLANFLSSPSGSSPVFTLEACYRNNSHHMSAAAKASVNNLARLLKQYPNAEITIYGYVDPTESEQYRGSDVTDGANLSTIRARCLYRMLITRGVPASQLKFEGAGSKPVADNATTCQNRRNDIVVTKW
jgi:outer membrane protein OmpA-like peptidoglycan-associated protein/uncharacterized protein YegP (UPF0339 family)